MEMTERTGRLRLNSVAHLATVGNQLPWWGVATFAVLVAAAMLTISCGGSPNSPSGNSNLRLMLTDAPIDDVDEVHVYFTSATVKPVGRSVEELLTLELEENPVDLLTLEASVIDFAAGVVPPGEYEFIHINIDESRSYLVENGVRKSLQIPSEEIKIVGGFQVGDDSTTALTLDFDAKASLLLRGNGEWLMRPIVVMTGNNTSSTP
jgi:hypothetical protein